MTDPPRLEGPLQARHHRPGRVDLRLALAIVIATIIIIIIIVIVI